MFEKRASTLSLMQDVVTALSKMKVLYDLRNDLVRNNFLSNDHELVSFCANYSAILSVILRSKGVNPIYTIYPGNRSVLKCRLRDKWLKYHNKLRLFTCDTGETPDAIIKSARKIWGLLEFCWSSRLVEQKLPDTVIERMETWEIYRLKKLMEILLQLKVVIVDAVMSGNYDRVIFKHFELVQSVVISILKNRSDDAFADPLTNLTHPVTMRPKEVLVREIEDRKDFVGLVGEMHALTSSVIIVRYLQLAPKTSPIFMTFTCFIQGISRYLLNKDYVPIFPHKRQNSLNSILKLYNNLLKEVYCLPQTEICGCDYFGPWICIHLTTFLAKQIWGLMLIITSEWNKLPNWDVCYTGDLERKPCEELVRGYEGLDRMGRILNRHRKKVSERERVVWDNTFTPLNDLSQHLKKIAKKKSSAPKVSGGGRDCDLTLANAMYLDHFEDTESVKFRNRSNASKSPNKKPYNLKDCFRSNVFSEMSHSYSIENDFNSLFHNEICPLMKESV